MIKTIFKKLASIIVFVIISFIIDLILGKIVDFPLKKIIIFHGALYLFYGGITLISYLAFDSLHTYEELHQTKVNVYRPLRPKLYYIAVAIISGFLLISLEAFI